MRTLGNLMESHRTLKKDEGTEPWKPMEGCGTVRARFYGPFSNFCSSTNHTHSTLFPSLYALTNNTSRSNKTISSTAKEI